jgi:heat-inducible transcriptional repressor
VSDAVARPRDLLSERQRRILGLVVERYVATGVPVGSKHIAGAGGLEVSSSTIRYERARLEDLGYLNQPHTSAGRVPTDNGYRYYADAIVGERPARPPAQIQKSLEAGEMRREIDSALRRLAETLGQVTNLLGVVTAPAQSTATIRHVEVLLLQPQLVMAVVITSTGGVGKRVFHFDAPVDGGLVEWAAAFLNERVAGLPVGARLLSGRLAEAGLNRRERSFIDALAPAVTDLDAEEEQVLYVGGRARLLSEERRPDLEVVDALMQLLEERYAVLALLREALARSEVYVRIGGELADQGLGGASLVAANYGIARRNLGTVSVFGPTRMDYRLAIASVREAALALSEFVEEVYE